MILPGHFLFRSPAIPDSGQGTSASRFASDAVTRVPAALSSFSSSRTCHARDWFLTPGSCKGLMKRPGKFSDHIVMIISATQLGSLRVVTIRANHHPPGVQGSWQKLLAAAN